jgi:hypothetical protein
MPFWGLRGIEWAIRLCFIEIEWINAGPEELPEHHDADEANPADASSRDSRRRVQSMKSVS